MNGERAKDVAPERYQISLYFFFFFFVFIMFIIISLHVDSTEELSGLDKRSEKSIHIRDRKAEEKQDKQEKEEEEKEEKGEPIFYGPVQPTYRDTTSTVFSEVKDSAFLPCSVANLGDKSVTWMRKRDLHILTAGTLTYSADERFKVLHKQGTEEWTLQIKFSRRNDSGVYECHVNSDPKISRQVTLIVKDDSQVEDSWIFGNFESTSDPGTVVLIEGPSERHIQSGSVLALTCITHHPPRKPPDQVLWFHGNTIIDYDSPRGGISVQTEKFPEKTISKVMLTNVKESDTGKYSCNPSGFNPTVIFVHVQQGQLEAVVQHGVFSQSPPPVQSDWKEHLLQIASLFAVLCL